MMNKPRNKAVTGLPIALLVALIVTSIGLSLLSLSVFHFWNNTQEHQTIAEVEKIVSEAETMFAYANEGTMVQMSVELPHTVNTLVFGTILRDTTRDPSTITLDENLSNNYGICPFRKKSLILLPCISDN